MNKIEIARDFINHHKWGIDAWFPLVETDESEKLEIIYNSIIEGNYGEVRINGSEAEIEISKYDSKSHQPIIFAFELADGGR